MKLFRVFVDYGGMVYIGGVCIDYVCFVDGECFLIGYKVFIYEIGYK